MKILIINIDSKIPNLALAKIEMFHRNNGNEIIKDIPLMQNSVDKIYVSCIFTKNYLHAKNYEGIANIGGSGYDLKIKLPDEIENLKPKINLGFASRGCIRRCPFCIVPEKEGKIRAVADLYDIWDGHSKLVTLLDNHIMALPEHFRLICQQAQKENITLDFNQGLDIRLLSSESAELISKTKLKRIRFALDYPELIPICRDKIKLLRNYLRNAEPVFYVLVGYNTTIEQDLMRLEFLKSMNCRAYVMQHENSYGSKIHMRMRQWANMFWSFMKYDFKEFIYVKDNEYIKFDRQTENLFNVF